MMKKRLTIHKSTSSIIIFGIFFGILFTLSLFAALRNESMRIPLFIILGVAVFVCIWFKSLSLEITDGYLRYHSLFGRTKEIQLEDIEIAYTEMDVLRFKDVFRPFVRLVIQPKKNINIKEFYINLKVFELRDIKKLFEVVPMSKK